MSESVWDDPTINVAGVGIDLDQLDLILGREAALNPRVDWRVVDRWCKDHPLQVRVFGGRPQQTSTHVRNTYPELTLRTTNARHVEGRAGTICDVLVCFVPEGEVSPFDELPGRVVRPVR